MFEQDRLAEMRNYEHGTRYCYVHGKCRCEQCVEENRRYHRELVRGYRSGPVPAQVHGTINGYINYACRCASCKEAGSKNNREVARRRKERS